VYEEVRRECDFVDLPRTLDRFRALRPQERNFPQLAALVLCYPFATGLFPRALEVVRYLKTIGTVALLSDGDPVYQPAKIARAGLADAVDGHVLVFAHKEEHLDEVQRQYPADRYVLVDDKPQILAAAKAALGRRLLTVHIDQGKYAQEHDASSAADMEVGALADLLRLTRDDFQKPLPGAH
jgi:FMN phosphatase YigB (HAD superfamily)